MKRYKLYSRMLVGDPDPEKKPFIEGQMVEDPEGLWVKWEDHKKESFRFTEIYEKRIRELKAKIGQECNCKEKYKEAWQWICSVHGYKRR